MFHTMITLAYVIPNIYVFLRIWQLFINKGYKLHFTVVYLLLASLYPVSNLVSEDSSGIIPSLLNTVTGYLLPFYLYLFLAILLFDIFLLINIFVKIISAEQRKTTGFKTLALGSIIVAAVAVVVAGAINFNTIRTTLHSVEIEGKTSDIKGLRVAFVSDFHLKQGVSRKFVERFVEKANGLKPDLMIFGGDIVEGDRNDGNLEVFEKLLSTIETTYGTYGVLGNHEYYSGREDGGFFEKSGITLLNDTAFAVGKSFTLAGRFDSHFRMRKSIDEFMKSLSDTLPVVLIDHRPTDIDQVSKTVADIQISGHTHNGQMFPINLITRKVYELSYGYLKKGNTHFFVSSGIRLWGPPVRTVNKSEILVIDIKLR
jgi:predicted MPP superfamily phosphohydrolase